MNNVVNLNDEREINSLINRLGSVISANPQRAKDYLMQDETVIISLRVSTTLLDRIERLVRKQSYVENKKVNRSGFILDVVASAVDHLEKSDNDKG